MFDFDKKSSNSSRIIFKRISADRLTPIKILSQSNVKVLLESAYIETGRSRYSIMILNNAFTIYKKNNKIYLKDSSGKDT